MADYPEYNDLSDEGIEHEINKLSEMKEELRDRQRYLSSLESARAAQRKIDSMPADEREALLQVVRSAGDVSSAEASGEGGEG